jgi:hypothetical protein
VVIIRWIAWCREAIVSRRPPLTRVVSPAKTSHNAVRASCGLSRMCLPAKPAGRVAYCRECGWNGSFAAEEIGQSLRALPFVFVIFVLLSLFTKRRIGILSISGFALIWTSTNAARLLYQGRELEGIGRIAVARPARASTTALDTTLRKKSFRNGSLTFLHRLFLGACE